MWGNNLKRNFIENVRTKLFYRNKICLSIKVKYKQQKIITKIKERYQRYFYYI